MHPRVYRAFESICADRNAGGKVLEVGARPSEETLLCMKHLRNAIEKIGINIEGPGTYKDITIVEGNANSMDCFEDNRFDTVLCNAMLEHDMFFWKTVSEIRRVARPGGLIVIGAPGFAHHPIEKIKSYLKKIPIVRNLEKYHRLDVFFNGTVTLEVHDDPGDYYRFSVQAFKEVIFEGMKDVRICSIMAPPRIIGSGIKP